MQQHMDNICDSVDQQSDRTYTSNLLYSDTEQIF